MKMIHTESQARADAAREADAGHPDQSAGPADTRKPCTYDGAGRGPGRACVVKAGGRLGYLWRCAEGCNGCDDCTDYEA